MGRTKNDKTFCSENLKGIDHLGDLSVDGRTVLKMSLDNIIQAY
jgi:hypothetical protein